jgi:hypothetical protein
MASSKKGIATRQLQRTFGGSMKTAWFLGHRVRVNLILRATVRPAAGKVGRFRPLSEPR